EARGLALQLFAQRLLRLEHGPRARAEGTVVQEGDRGVERPVVREVARGSGGRHGGSPGAQRTAGSVSLGRHRAQRARVPAMRAGITLVTGAGGGIGAATGTAFGREDRRLLLSDLNAAALGGTVRSLDADGVATVALAGDLAAAEGREALAAAVER